MNNPAESYVLPGRNNRFTEIAAAMGLSQLRCLPEFLTHDDASPRSTMRSCSASELFVPLLAGEMSSVPSYWRYVGNAFVENRSRRFCAIVSPPTASPSTGPTILRCTCNLSSGNV